ncbi:hypothetical protein KPL42_07865 [Clostridium gasigenes]|uniref:hypothetical protein n=1 Tax=Clostridium gasigenes TaxID=94869 RepID=UPI001C0BA3DC|nr:hypothetical protein [Clostridium gasigenes]MBU3088407.1 hypothetical protein [Clostridium gasigenes]
MNKRKFLIGLSVAGALVFGGTLSFASMRDADTAQVNKLAIESKQVNTEAKQTNIEATPVDTNAIESGVDTNSVATNEVATNEVATEASNAPAEVTNEVQKQLLVSPAPEEKVATVKEASNDVAKAIDSQNSCSNACPSTCINGCNQGCGSTCVNGCNQGCESTCVNECNQGCQSTCTSNSTKENNTCSNSNGCSKVKVIQGENVDNTTNGTCPTQSTTNTCPNTNE